MGGGDYIRLVIRLSLVDSAFNNMPSHLNKKHGATYYTTVNSNNDWKGNLAAIVKANLKLLMQVSPRLQDLFILQGSNEIHNSATKINTRLNSVL